VKGTKKNLDISPIGLIGLILLIAAVVAVTVATARAQAKPSDWDRIVEAAKKEGEVVASIPPSPERSDRRSD